MQIFSKLSLALLILATLASCSKEEKNYKEVPNDPLKVRIYTLENGLTVYLSENKDEPRIYTNVAIRTGSKNDPEQYTGLAHYLEHMLFKGTDKIGTVNWEAEKAELAKIAALYEEHAKAEDQEIRTAIYKKIDSISTVAASYAVPNELDKLVKSVGASGTNAYTWHEETVYLNDIPSNELEKWAMLESERMSQLVLRLFHTELEAVYEEFNLGQASDFRKASYKGWEMLFPNHPYGQQTTIGTAEHLKRPSMLAIEEYFKNYYVASNMAVILSGDFNSDEAIKIIEKHFGSKLMKGEVNRREMPVEKPLTSVQKAEVFGPQQEFINILFRFGGINTPDSYSVELIADILSNGMAGLFDLNLIQKQKVLNANAYAFSLQDYTVLTLSASPKQGQTLEETEDLLLAEIKKIKAGDFDLELLNAVIKNKKLDNEKVAESNYGRVDQMVESFVRFYPWENSVNRINKQAEITKEELVKFANENFLENYVTIYKRMGTDPNTVVVEKPAITPINIDRSKSSEFAKMFDSIPSSRLNPVFVDFKTALKSEKLDGKVPVYYVKNDKNKTFSLNLILETGTESNPKLALAANYLPYLGTTNYSAEDLKKKLYSLGLSINVFTTGETSYIFMSGLDESFNDGMDLLLEMLNNAQPNEEALKELIADEKKKRANRKLSNRAISQGLRNYAMYGENSPFSNQMTNEELDALTGAELVDILKNIPQTEHLIMYYGSKNQKDAMKEIAAKHKLPETMMPLPGKKDFEELPMAESKVYFAHYDQVTADLSLLSKGKTFDASLLPYTELFGEYFGFGLSSIVFQEIREAKALAYTAGAYVSSPNKVEKSHYLNAFISTQNDKLPDALAAMSDLLNNMPEAEAQFEGAKLATLKDIETNRITGSSIFWTWYSNQKLGIENDRREDIYNGVKNMNINDMKSFFNENVSGKTFNYLVVGRRDLINQDHLKTLGEVKELSLEEIFGY